MVWEHEVNTLKRERRTMLNKYQDSRLSGISSFAPSNAYPRHHPLSLSKATPSRSQVRVTSIGISSWRTTPPAMSSSACQNIKSSNNRFVRASAFSSFSVSSCSRVSSDVIICAPAREPRNQPCSGLVLRLRTVVRTLAAAGGYTRRTFRVVHHTEDMLSFDLERSAVLCEIIHQHH